MEKSLITATNVTLPALKASNLNVPVKTHSGEKSNATSVTIHLPLLVI